MYTMTEDFKISQLKQEIEQLKLKLDEKDIETTTLKRALNDTFDKKKGYMKIADQL